MPGIHDTAYPRLKSSVSAQELAAVYTPTAEEVTLAHQVAKDTRNRICFLVLLKTFQRLGYFELLHKIPPPIAEHIALLYGVHHGALEWEAYDGSGTRRRHVAFIRDRLSVKPFDDASRKLLAESVRQAARVKEDTADIINVAIEELIRQRYELPGFTTLLVESQRGKAEVNRHFYSGVCRALGAQRCRKIDEMLEADQPNRRSLWQNLKLDAGAPTLTQLRLLAQRLEWLKTLGLTSDDSFAGVPPVKVAHFALEARSLDAGRMLEMEEQKRYTLAAALVRQQRARCLDDLGEMLIKRMRKAHRRAQEAYDEYLLRQQSQTDQLIAVLRQILLAWQTPGSKVERLEAIGRAIGDQAEQLIAECQTRAAYADRNFLPFLWRFCRSSRRLLFAVLEQIELIATGPDGGLERALRFVRKNRACHKEWITLPEAGPPNDAEAFDLSWVPDKWWPLITGRELRHQQAGEVRRRYFELCALTQLAHALQSGDFIIAGSDKFSDYRDQLVSPEEYGAAVGEYCAEVGLPANKPTIIDELRRLLEQTARRADAGFPENEHLRIEHGEPVLRRLERRPEPEQLRLIEQLVAETLQPVSILDVLADTEHWLNWTKHFGPLSGHEAKLEEPASGYVATVFSYGCNLGPTQTARALKCADRRRIAWINQRHITEDHLDAAVAQIINAYNRFLLPTMWGTGQRASADGTKWDLYAQNLLSEYHIRYGGYGGIGYYHISDKYIALFSHFIPCGVWEAVYILDGLLQNRSEIQPDTVHADTQGQSAPVFGLAYLLGIKLMPRIRNWKDLKFYRPGKQSRYEHIDGLFSEVIDWGLIEENLDDLLRVAVSIRAGRLTASAILRRLGAYSRRNRLYLAFRELGRVVRTEFLLNYIGSLELRHVIQGAINKSESFNKFAQWVSFGGHGLLAENNREEQRKLIKYNHLVANSLIFYNVYAMTEALHRLRREAVALSKETLQRLSPYLTAHVNRFGDYQLDPNRKPPDLNYDLEIFPSGTST